MVKKALSISGPWQQVEPPHFFCTHLGLDSKFGQGDIVWVETPKNPTADIEDITAWSKLAQAAQAILVVDSTFATPILQRPLDFGADVVMHSSTKFLSGTPTTGC